MNSPDRHKPIFLTLMTRTLLVAALSTVALPQSGQAKPNTPTPANATHADKPAGVAVDEAFLIGADDVLGIDVWKEAEVTRTVTVRSDGKISLPLIGEVQAAGKTPKQLQEDIRSKLAGFIADPEVTLVVQEVRSHRFNILGQVQHPGAFPLGSSTTVLDAIAEAGGFRDFAKQKGIYILRTNPDGSQVRIPFNYREVIKGDAKQNVRLENHDTVIVP
jgi:polysaccharide biosynthesis/export protein